MRLITWNINSVRLRIDLVRRLLAEAKPDVLCLQETKTPDELFPREALEAAGYRHMLVHGMKGYNGVAILAREPFVSSTTRAWCARKDCRHGVVELPGGIEAGPGSQRCCSTGRCTTPSGNGAAQAGAHRISATSRWGTRRPARTKHKWTRVSRMFISPAWPG